MTAGAVVTGVIGLGDSLYKAHQVKMLQERLDKVEKIIKEKEEITKLYVPSFVEMDTYKKSFIDGNWDKDKRKK